MVQELRRITLNKAELISSLESHRRMTPNFLPDGEIIDFDIIDHTSIMITVETDPSMREASVVPDDKIVQALIRFCLENNIVLPREGHKSVLVAKDDVSLCIALDIDTQVTGISDRARSSAARS